MLKLFSILIFGVLAFSIYASFVHNQYVFPLGRLSLGIDAGQDCSEVRKHLEKYYADRQQSHGVTFSASDMPDAGPWSHRTDATKIMNLYDPSSLFDDAELIVLCSEAGKVVESIFVGD